MNRQEIERVVLLVLETVLKAEVDLSTSRENNAKWDSLKHIEVIFAIEDELNVQFSEEELPDLNSVSHIVDRVLSLHAA
jgi:acyl carrier protein